MADRRDGGSSRLRTVRMRLALASTENHSSGAPVEVEPTGQGLVRRKSVQREIRELIRRMANENITWGAPRLHAELLKLGYAVTERTVSRYLPKRPAEPDAIERWKIFLRNHEDDIAATDFFTVPKATFRVLYAFFEIHHSRRQLLHFNVTAHPSSEWVISSPCVRARRNGDETDASRGRIRAC